METVNNKLVMTMPVTGYPDELRDNVLYHSKFHNVDGFVILLHKPDDKTEDMVKLLAKDLELIVLINRGDRFGDGDWRTEMAITAREKLGAGWVFSNDSDEYLAISSTNGGEIGLKMILQRMGKNNVVYFNRRNVLPFDSYPMEISSNPARHFVHIIDNPVQNKTIRDKPFTEITPEEYLVKSVAGKAVNSTTGLVKIHDGSHEIEIADRQSIISDDLIIYHYPYFSVEKFLRDTRRKVSAKDLAKYVGTTKSWHLRFFQQLDNAGLLERFVEGLFDSKLANKITDEGLASVDEQVAKKLKLV